MDFWLAAIFSLTSVIFYSLISIYIGSVTKKFGSFWTSFWIQIIALPLTLLFLPFFGLNLAFNIYLLPIAIFGVGISFSFILYCKTLSIGPPAVVQSILRTGNLVTFLLAVIFLNESITFLKVIGSIIVIIGAVMVSLDIGQLLGKKIKLLTQAVPLTIFQAILSAILFVILGIGTKHFDGFSSSVGTRLFIIPTFLLMSLTQARPNTPFLKISWKILFFIAFGDVIAFILYNMSVKAYEVSFAAIMQSTIPVFTAIISYLFFKEKLGIYQKLGIVITVMGAMILGIK